MDANEEEDMELGAAESEFRGDPTEDRVGTQPKVAQQAMEEKVAIEHSQEILIALGFIRYDNRDQGTAYKLNIPPLQVGRTFTTLMPAGNMWVRCLEDCEHGKKNKFMKREDIKQIPLVDLFYKIRDGKLSIPEPTVSGKIVGKSKEAVEVQFTEFNRIETKWWGLGALKKTQEGVTYVPASYSKHTKKYDGKMQVPRDIILVDYDAELSKASATATGRLKGRHPEKPSEKVEKETLAEALLHKEPVSLPETEKPTVDYYVNLIGEITEKVNADERIAKNERGYAINMVFHAYTKDTRTALIAELKNGEEVKRGY